MRVRKVPAEFLTSAAETEWADQDKKPYVEGNAAYIPVREGYYSTGTLHPRKPYHGRGYYMVGQIAVVRGKKPSREELDTLISWQKPQGVLWVRSLSGNERVPDTELLHGTAGEVIHREQGFSYLLDPAQVMFSQGNRIEKVRMAESVMAGERVADMFAGIGYFSIPMAGAGASVHAMEINPVAFHYLLVNTRLNKVSLNIFPECGDCRLLLKGEYDRVVMGHFDSVSALPAALEHVHEGSVLHIHSSGERPVEISGILKNAGYKGTVSVRKVKKTGPRRWHFVGDVTLE